MALPPTIPTSFVPYSASASARKFRSDFIGAFGFFAYGVLILSVVLSLGVFMYGRILDSSQAAKDEALAAEEGRIDQTTAENFVRLRNRLESSEKLLNNHVAFSGFFAALEKMLPSSARLSSLHISMDNKGGIKLEAAGVAKSFNVLAVLSSSMSKDGRIKEAIFSNIVINNKDNSVSFALSAALDPKLVTYEVPKTVTAPKTATTTPPLP